MKVSYKWLNEYFDGKLPKVEKAAEILTMNSSEVDAVEKVGNDYLLDVKILPNMAHSCLCHRGIAQEFGALLDLKTKKYCRDFEDYKIGDVSKNLKVVIENPADCRRYIGRVIENVRIGSSPKWLEEKLETIGQRSINNLVDATNFVMNEIGQPMHVFDADKLVGDTIEIKRVKVCDQIKTLDGRFVDLDESVLTISNNNKSLAIAGIKGGVIAEIDENTKNIVLESANFNPTLIRKTSQRIKIQTDASKRYENDLTPELAGEAMDILTKLIVEIAGTKNTKVGEMVDMYPVPAEKVNLGISAKEVEKVLGLKISEKEIEKIFKCLNFNSKKDGDKIVVEVPAERLDLRIKEDLIEEILKVYGYDKLKDNTSLVPVTKGQINKSFYYANKIKELLSNEGFSEIYGYAFAEKGDVELANSVAPDKKFLRANLIDGFKNYLEFNTRYSELVAMPQIKIFEIGKVFGVSEEYNSLVIGVQTPVSTKGLKKDKDVLEAVITILERELGIKLEKINNAENIAEFNFDEIVAKLSEPKTYDIKLPMAEADMRFKKISIYPFSVRDVAVFTPEGTKQEDVWAIIEKEAGVLLVKDRLFDVFTKKFPDGSAKTSYAFRLVLQSYDHTLSEDEIIGVMTRIITALNSQTGWQVR